MAEFLQKYKELSSAESSLYLSIRFAGITIGRIAGSFFIDKLGYLKSLVIFSAITFCCLTMGIFGPLSCTFFLAFTGFGLSIIFPTATACITRMTKENSGKLLGAFLACGGLGGMLGPWLVGIVSDLSNIKIGMAVNIVFCVAILLTFPFQKQG